MSNRIRFCLGICIAASAAALPSTAGASDDKSYHASQCMATDGIETDYSRSEYRITRVGGQGGGALMCPVVRDVFECSGWGGCVTGSAATVRVYDAHVAGQVRCSFSARSETGSSLYYSSDATNYSLAQGNDVLNMSGMWPAGSGMFSLRCEMPQNNGSGYTKIFGYRISEFD